MAVTQFAFCSVHSDLPGVPYVAGATTEVETPTGSNSVTTAAATKTQNVCVVATDTDVYVSFGANPDASTDNVKFLVPENTVRMFRVSPGDKAAVVTLS